MDTTHELDALLGATLEVVVDKLGWRGEGLVRVANGWLSIRGVHAGERVRVRVAERKASRGHAYATLEDVVEPSPRRAPTECDAFPICAGCHLRHFRLEDERDLKLRWLDEILEKYAASHDAPPSSYVGAAMNRSDGARHRGTLTLVDGELGIRVPGLPTLQTMRECAALTPAARALTRSLSRAFAGHAANGWVDWLAPTESAPLVNLRCDHPPDVISALTDEGFGVFVHGTHQAGPASTRMRIGQHVHDVDFSAWTHTTEMPSSALYEWVSDAVHTDSSVLDLGAGMGGVSAVALSAGAKHVVAADRDLGAIGLARRNLVGPRIRFIAGEFEKVLRGLTIDAQIFDLTVINPMRDPVGGRTMSYVDRVTRDRLIYLAPSPVSAARDLDELPAGSWKITRCAVIDLHPGTYHFMAGIILDRLK